jgi:hypothetical protein
VEGRHFVAGPWFTVQETGADWETLETFWLSDGGNEQTRVRVDIKLRLEELRHES